MKFMKHRTYYISLFKLFIKMYLSECVIHGIHKNHDVINIKKAYPLVYGKIEELCSNINDKVKNIKKLNDNIEKKIFKI